MVTDWFGCYEQTWHDIIVPEAFAHPAKMSRSLLQRIYAHLSLMIGSTVVDPFGGIGTTAIEGAWLGHRVVCCELEPKFVALAQENFKLHRRKWETLGLPMPRIVCGDSRRLREHIGSVVDTMKAEQQGGRSASSASQDTDSRYGDTAGQLAKMEKSVVDAVIASPPFQNSGTDADKEAHNRQVITSGMPTHRINAKIGKTDYADSVKGNIGAQMSDATFWSAASDIVAESYAILKPGGRAAWVVKAFVRKGQIVDFPGNWRRLCEHVGFQTELEVHALLIKSTTETDLFGEEVTETKARKSFFRRLAEAKGAPPIDFEVVLIMVKR